MFYRLVVAVVKFLARILYRLEYDGEENIPAEGGFVVVANHPPTGTSFSSRSRSCRGGCR